MQIFTTTLIAGSLTIDKADGIQFVSIKCDAGGSCTILGTLPFKTTPSSAVTLSAGEGLNLNTNLSSSPLDGIVITWVAGSIDIIMTYL